MISSEEGQAFRFGEFALEVENRRLLRKSKPVKLSARYFDALTLLVREHGNLVRKDRLFDEVWGDVVVSDSALTQCIKDIRRVLGDDAAHPRFIETVPGHGYRFIAPLAEATAPVRLGRGSLVEASVRGLAGTLGAGFAGVIGGLLYGAGLAFAPAVQGLGTASVLLVVLALTVVVSLLGGLGVAFGMALGSLIPKRPFDWVIVGGAVGGMLVGGVTKLLGLDAFNLFFGNAPTGMTGGFEGLIFGGSVGLGAWFGHRFGTESRWSPAVGSGAVTAIAGGFIPLMGGRLLGGSLDLMARSFAGSRLQMDTLGRAFGELQFGTQAQMFLGGIEGLLFGFFVTAAMMLSRDMLSRQQQPISDLVTSPR